MYSHTHENLRSVHGRIQADIASDASNIRLGISSFRLGHNAFFEVFRDGIINVLVVFM